MKKHVLYLLIFLVLSSTLHAQGIRDTIFDSKSIKNFAFGADISWLSQMESWGNVFKDDNGVQKDLMVILKEHGVNALRFRVWVNPSGGWSGKTDVVNLSKRAHQLGFKVMIDFHYSDSWADPGKQTKPAAWANHTIDQLVTDVYNHTFDVLSTLKRNGITPVWVQIGNETKRGMLWPEGSTDTSMKNFAMLINGGYDAVKAVDSTMQAIVHLPDGDENSLYRWMFDGLKKNGAKWDIIGMSAYPHWAHLDWKTEINQVVANMKDMVSRFNTKVMVVETGYDWDKPYEANNFLVEMMDTMMAIGGLGAFYWEPESMSGYALGAWNPNTKQPTIAMDAFQGIKHTDPATLIKVTLDQPLGGKIFQPDENIALTATASRLNGNITKVTFYVNDKPVAVKTEMPYTFIFPNPGSGNYNIYATATDHIGMVVKSAITTVQVGIIAMFQESTSGYCGISNNKGTLDTNHPNYTGTGFINTNNEAGVAVNWTVNFLGLGKYRIEYRYAAPSTRPGLLTINGKSIGTVAFPSTGSWDTWAFSSVDYIATTIGEAPISIASSTADGLPNIDYMSIRSIDNVNKTEPSTRCLDQPMQTMLSNGKENELSIYQRSNKQNIFVASKKEIISIRMYRSDGLLVKKVDHINKMETEITCPELIAGVYLMVLSAHDETFLKTFAIE